MGLDDGVSWSKQSITEQNDLDELFHVAQLSGRDFAAGTFHHDIVFILFFRTPGKYTFTFDHTFSKPTKVTRYY